MVEIWLQTVFGQHRSKLLEGRSPHREFVVVNLDSFVIRAEEDYLDLEEVVGYLLLHLDLLQNLRECVQIGLIKSVFKKLDQPTILLGVLLEMIA